MAANVARLRKAKGLSQAALAEAMRGHGQGHWRQNTVSRVETGKQDVAIGELGTLVFLLGDVLEGTRVTGTDMGSAPRDGSTGSLVGDIAEIDAHLTAAREALARLKQRYSKG